MNSKAIIVLIGFLGWSVLSWNWYICKIKQKCDDEPKTALIQTNDTVSTDANIKFDSVAIDTTHEKSVQVLKDRTLLYFQTKSTSFDQDSSISFYLSELSKKLILSKDSTITIIGHTDDKGRDEDNTVLSFQRAKDVRMYLVNKGVPFSKIKIDGKGEKEPIVADTTDEARNKNRRVEIIFTNP